MSVYKSDNVRYSDLSVRGIKCEYETILADHREDFKTYGRDDEEYEAPDEYEKTRMMIMACGAVIAARFDHL